MLVQPVSKSTYSPSCKALYFVKTPTIALKDAKDVFVHEATTTTESGIKFIEDNNITEKVKKRFAKMPFIKNLAEFETFVWFVESKGNEGYRSWAKITHVDAKGEQATNNYVIAKSEYSQETATNNMFHNLHNQNFTVL